MDNTDKVTIIKVALVVSAFVFVIYLGFQWGIFTIEEPERNPSGVFIAPNSIGLHVANLTAPFGTPVFVIDADIFTIQMGNATMTMRNVNGTIVIEGAKLK